MKAIQYSRFGGPQVLELVELPDPHPGNGQIRIAVRAAGSIRSTGSCATGSGVAIYRSRPGARQPGWSTRSARA